MVLIKDLSGSHQQECTMRRISPAHNMTREIPSRMLSMFRRGCCLSTWGIISSATSSWGMASGDKLALSTHCWYSFLFFFLRKYFSNVTSHRKHCPGFYISYSNSNEQPSQYWASTTSQALCIRQLEKACGLSYDSGGSLAPGNPIATTSAAMIPPTIFVQSTSYSLF